MRSEARSAIVDPPVDSFFRGEESALKNLRHNTVNRKGLRIEIELLEGMQAQRLSGANQAGVIGAARSNEVMNRNGTGGSVQLADDHEQQIAEHRAASNHQIVQTNPMGVSQ